MKKTVEQLEANTTASFAYVKKDILMLNEAVNSLVDKIQKVSDRLDKIENSRKKKSTRKLKRK